MLTRCPSCATHFRVTTEQLKARSGRVRCGACQHVFNALDSLIEEPAPAPLPAPALPEPVPFIQEQAGDDALAVALAPTPEVATPAEADDAVRTEAGQLAPAQTPAAWPEADRDEPDTARPDSARAKGVAGNEAPAAADGWDTPYAEPPPPSRRWPWAIASLLALFALGLQAALAFRVEMAVLWPEFRPALVALCDAAECEVGLPTKVGLVGIEASDLHPDSERKGRLTLSATLKNRAPFAQQFPHLELTLTDTADKAIARKVLAPNDYLPPATRTDSGMPPNADIALTVVIDVGELPASGYRLYLFYP